MHPLYTSGDLSPLLDDIGDRSIVMLGEASHGTHEFYTWRTAITRRLIEEKGFSFIGVEGDWPDCYQLNRYVKGYEGGNIEEVLRHFDRWPSWMWSNWEIAALAEWLKEYNTPLPAEKKVGFYGLDVYSLWDSMRAMIGYLEREDPSAAQTARKAFSCFEPYINDEQRYARQAMKNHRCRDELQAMLREVRLKIQFLDSDREAGFNAEQNALIAVNAEKYYSSITGFDHESWNIRDRHMMETLQRLLLFHGQHAKGIVWEHNTHIGDARATSMQQEGMVNVGQLARESYGQENVYLCGFASYQGTVIAGYEWGAPMEIMEVPEARPGSIESVLHDISTEPRYVLFSEDHSPLFNTEIRHRAIGVVYYAPMENYGNYVPSVLSQRYDALIFLDKTKALYPLYVYTDKHKLPATYPFSI